MKLSFNNEQVDLLKQMNFKFDFRAELNDDQILELDEKVSDYFALNGLDSSSEVNQIGIICESIIDMLAEL